MFKFYRPTPDLIRCKPITYTQLVLCVSNYMSYKYGRYVKCLYYININGIIYSM